MNKENLFDFEKVEEKVEENAAEQAQEQAEGQAEGQAERQAEEKVRAKYIRNKRKKISLVDHQKIFQHIQMVVADNRTRPPLIHTPHSMFNMLCDTFEKEFPNCLPQHMRDQCLSIIMNK